MSSFMGSEEAPLTMQLLVTGGANSFDGLAFCGFVGLSGDPYVEGLLRLHNPCYRDIRSVATVKLTLIGQTSVRQSYTQPKASTFLELVQNPVTTSADSNVVLLPNSVHDIPFRFNVSDSHFILPPSLEVKSSTNGYPIEAAVHYEIQVEAEVHSSISIRKHERKFRLRFPRFDKHIILPYLRQERVHHENLTDAGITYKIVHPASIIPGGVIPLRVRTVFAGKDGAKFAKRFLRYKVEMVESVSIQSPIDGNVRQFSNIVGCWEFVVSPLNCGSKKDKKDKTPWSDGEYGPVFERQENVQAPVWPAPLQYDANSELPSPPPSHNSNTKTVSPTASSLFVSITHSFIITLKILKHPDVRVSSPITVVPATPEMIAHLTGEHAHLVVEAMASAAGGDGPSSKTAPSDAGTNAPIDEDEALRQAIAASMAGIVDRNVVPTAPAQVADDEEDEMLKRAILASMEEVGGGVGGGVGREAERGLGEEVVVGPRTNPGTDVPVEELAQGVEGLNVRDAAGAETRRQDPSTLLEQHDNEDNVPVGVLFGDDVPVGILMGDDISLGLLVSAPAPPFSDTTRISRPGSILDHVNDDDVAPPPYSDAVFQPTSHPDPSVHLPRSSSPNPASSQPLTKSRITETSPEETPPEDSNAATTEADLEALLVAGRISGREYIMRRDELRARDSR
ncbi:hypothetical protein HK104_008606 [Borealophlyctis nickersoniae]|nr:hypothetical protein HK104_008606 [Borealophlyctis nickersoniae]